MMAKYDITKNGVPFMEFVGSLFGGEDDILANTELQWRDALIKSSGWKSMRNIERIEQPIGLIDHLWNDAFDAVAHWQDHAGKLEDLNLAEVAQKSYGRRGVTLPAWAFREMRARFVRPWGKYWADAKQNGVSDHRYIYQLIHEEGERAEWQVLAALLTWVPADPEKSDGFALKWAAIFQTHRGTEILGMNPDVEKRVEWKRQWKAAGKSKK